MLYAPFGSWKQTEGHQRTRRRSVPSSLPWPVAAGCRKLSGSCHAPTPWPLPNVQHTTSILRDANLLRRVLVVKFTVGSEQKTPRRLAIIVLVL